MRRIGIAAGAIALWTLALAGSAGADQADTVPVIDLELERAEEPLSAKRLSQFLCLEHLVPRNGQF